MTEEEFAKIMEDENIETEFPEGDNALAGLNIIAKYLPLKGIEGAGHDIIYSVGVDEIVKAGITQEDAENLRRINWMILDDNLACYV